MELQLSDYVYLVILSAAPVVAVYALLVPWYRKKDEEFQRIFQKKRGSEVKDSKNPSDGNPHQDSQ